MARMHPHPYFTSHLTLEWCSLGVHMVPPSQRRCPFKGQWLCVPQIAKTVCRFLQSTCAWPSKAVPGHIPSTLQAEHFVGS
jgi:hypothetical protein